MCASSQNKSKRLSTENDDSHLSLHRRNLYDVSFELSLASFCMIVSATAIISKTDVRYEAYQSLSSAMESMSMVASELWVGSLQGRVSVRLWLLDAN